MEDAVEEGDFPHAPQEKSTLIKQATMWFRIHGLLDRMLAAVKNLAALTMRMENRVQGPAPDYPPNQGPWVFYGDREPTPREPSWQKYALGIVAVVAGLGIPSIGGILWSMNTKLEQQVGQTNLANQRLDQVDKHLEATDRQVEEIKREIWPHKH